MYSAKHTEEKRKGILQKPTGYAGGGKKALASGDVSLQKSSFVLNCMQAGNRIQAKNKGERYMKNQNNDTYILAHTTWKCQYHIVFTPKYHRKIIYGALRAEIGKILRELCKRREVES